MRRRAHFCHGWVVVATSVLGLFFGAFPIVVSCFAIFFQSYVREFHASRASIALALTIHNLIAALLATRIGRLADRFGARKVVLPGLGVLGLLLLSAGRMGSKIWQLYAFYAALGVVSDATTSVPYCLAVSRWFDRRRGLALGLTMAGLGLGSIVMPLVVHQVIAGYGWRSAFAVAGGAILIVAVPLIALFMKEAPREMTWSADRTAGQLEGSTWREIRATPAYWLMVIAFVLAGTSINGCIVHMAQIFSDRGATEVSAAVAVSVGGLALLVGRAGTGYFLDRFSGAGVAFSVFSLAALGIALLLTRVAGPLALLGTFLVGLGFGAEVDIMAYLIGRYFGLRALGTAFGFAFGSFVLASGVGPLLMGAAFDRTRSYTQPLAAGLIATLLAAVQLSRLGPYRFLETPQPEVRTRVQPAPET